MNNDKIREKLNDYFGVDEDILNKMVMFENPSFSDAVIGVSNDDRLVYSYDKMIECLINEDNMTYEEAEEFIEYNTLRALPYASSTSDDLKAPIIMYSVF